MSNSNEKRPMFELQSEQPKQRRPGVKMPDLRPEVDDELPEGVSNAMTAIKMQQEASGQTREVPQPEREELKREETLSRFIPESPTLPEQPLGNKTAKDIIAQLKKRQRFEEVMLPSRSLIYGKYGLEPDKPVHVRPMTIEEEKVISTPRFIKSGQAIDQIFNSCVYENIPAGKLLSADRTFLLFYIRGISYGPDYEVDIKCPSCDMQFTSEVNLDTLPVEMCADDFNGEISCTLPDSGLAIRYRVPSGDDERALSRHREMMIRGGFRTDTPDDTLVRRNIMLISNIEGITNKIEIEQIINNLGMKDSNFLREKLNDPGFGIVTEITMSCDYCYHEWELDLPIDVNFFFPRTKRTS